MEEAVQRGVAQGLNAKTDAAKRQAQALDTLKRYLNAGTNIELFLPAIIEAALTRGTPLAVSILVDCVGKSLEQCSQSTSLELYNSLFQLVGSKDEGTACVAINALNALPPESFLQLLSNVGPEQLIRRCLQLSNPNVSESAAASLGQAVLKAWPCVATVGREKIRDEIVESLRLLFSQLSNDDALLSLRCGVASVLDTLMLEYLCVEPSHAPIAVFHPLWRFGALYGTLLVEVMHDLQPCIKQLAKREVVGVSCRWLPQGVVPNSADWVVCANEAAALRSALLWIFAHAGGLSCPHVSGEEQAGGYGSTIFDLTRQVVGGRRTSKLQFPNQEPLPPEVELLLREGSRATGSTASAAFTRSRATLMLAVVGIAKGEATDITRSKALLDAALTLSACVEDETGSLTNPMLNSLAVEGVCSAMALWSNMCLSPTSQDLESGAQICAKALLASTPANTLAPSSPNRRLQMLGLGAWVLVWNLARLRKPKALSACLMQSGLGTVRHLSALLLALLCRECCALVSRNKDLDSGVKAFSLDLAAEVIELASARLLLQAAPDGLGLAGADEFARWWLLALVRAGAGVGRDWCGPVADGLAKSALLAASPDIFITCASCLLDVDGIRQLPSAAKRQLMDVSAKAFGAASPAQGELRDYLIQLQSALREGGAVGARRLASHFSASSDAVRHLHLLFDSPGSSSIQDSDVRGESLSGPPLMLYVKVFPKLPGARKAARAVLRIDVYNCTALILNHLEIRIRATSVAKVDEPPSKDFSLVDGLSHPPHHYFETVPCRGRLTIWREISVAKFAPLWIMARFSYENTISVAPAPGSSAAAGPVSTDDWSDDEAEENARLNFACKPYLLPLSVFLQPFHGFDSPLGGVFPPVAVFIVCPHARPVVAQSGALAFDPDTWNPVGLHRISPEGCHCLDKGFLACFAGISCDASAILVLLFKKSAGGPILEIRSSTPAMLAAFASDLTSWLLAAAP